ncbi:alpha/beta hydrolase [Pontibacter chitinilyticus]|uniref:alpha/beta hydrolase n=1 Tax=Pontibacter chitinilyticus TaxID=2674989 RepID=UPI00321B26B7
MKKPFFFVFFSFVLFQGFAQTSNKIVLGTIDSIDSKILHEQRKIWVYVPKGGATDMYGKAKYPVVYLLDGDAHFYSVVGMIQQLSSVNGNTICPEMIVVGIPNTDRTRDLTPTHVDVDPMMMNDSSASRTSGGGEQFMAFIEKELMPHIDSVYPTLPYKTIIGHSLGGLTVMNTLINHKDLFNAYVAIDPSMWWDKKALLHKAADVLPKENYQNKMLFLGIANTMNKGMDTAKVRNDTTLFSSHIQSILSLNDVLQQNRNNGLSYDYKYYKNDNHGSVPLIATYDALHFIFGFYNFELTTDDLMNFSMETVAKLEKHYEDVSKHFGFTYNPPEVLVDNLAYIAWSQKKIPEVKRLLDMNITNYPTSFNAFNFMGDLQSAEGNKAKAIEYYRKALTIKEYPEARKKLNTLLKK